MAMRAICASFPRSVFFKLLVGRGFHFYQVDGWRGCLKRELCSWDDGKTARMLCRSSAMMNGLESNAWVPSSRARARSSGPSRPVQTTTGKLTRLAPDDYFALLKSDLQHRQVDLPQFHRFESCPESRGHMGFFAGRL